jgi:predicted TIM-barrel fold metal-dependent hydrolase
MSLPERIIDFHVHLFPDRFFDAIWKYFANGYGWDVLHHLYYRECIDHLRQHGVGPVVYSNYAHKKGIAKILNHWNLSILDETPDLYCFAAYHPDDKDSLDIAENTLSHPRVLGFKLQLLVQNFYPDDERLFPFYEMVIKKNKRILFHVGTGPVSNQFVGFSNFERLLKRYPKLPATVAHMGGLEYKQFFSLLDDYENLYFDTSFSFLPQAFAMFNLDKKCLEEYKHRIVYGSDFPNIIYPREEEIDCLLSLGLSKEFYQNIFWDNGYDLIRKHSGQ